LLLSQFVSLKSKLERVKVGSQHEEDVDQEVATDNKTATPAHIDLLLDRGDQITEAHHAVECEHEHHLVEVLHFLSKWVFEWFDTQNEELNIETQNYNT
jgi:hypothetical protein